MSPVGMWSGPDWVPSHVSSSVTVPLSAIARSIRPLASGNSLLPLTVGFHDRFLAFEMAVGSQLVIYALVSKRCCQALPVAGVERFDVCVNLHQSRSFVFSFGVLWSLSVAAQWGAASSVKTWAAPSLNS